MKHLISRIEKRHDAQVIQQFKGVLGVGHKALEDLPEETLRTLLHRLTRRKRQEVMAANRQKFWMGNANDFLDEIEFRDSRVKEPSHGLYDEMERRYG